METISKVEAEEDEKDKFEFGERFTFHKVLGHGAYGVVCKATDNLLGRNVAIKKVSQIGSTILIAKRTLRELKLLRHFHGHPNIVGIQGAFMATSTSTSNPNPSKAGRKADDVEEIYLTQELMDGDLCTLIQGKWILSEEHCQRLMYQLLRGLKAIHSANVVHRDLKPGNLLFKQATGELKICDFGLARSVRQPPESGDHGGGGECLMTNYVATRWYRPPELLLHRSSYGTSIDMWSVGCIMAEMLGRKVFLPGSSGLEQLHLIIERLGSPSEEDIDDVPSSKSRSYLRRLPKHPKPDLRQRFPAATAEAINLLERLLSFNPKKRIDVDGALRHPYLSRYHDPKREPRMDEIDMDFEDEITSLPGLKMEIIKEVNSYGGINGTTLPPRPSSTKVEKNNSGGGGAFHYIKVMGHKASELPIIRSLSGSRESISNAAAAAATKEKANQEQPNI